jgi:cytochrome d ubiquinol oxidase subunit II
MFGFLFIGFLVLEGFDYGVSMLLPFLGKSGTDRQAIINTLAPVWEGNEVWLIAASTVLFAGFPHVYATLFSGLYLALLLLLTSLILRGVAFEFRNKDINQNWRSFWDWTIFYGGAIPALLWGIAVTNLLNGMPINGEMQYVGTFTDLLSSYTLTGGLVFVLMFLLHGAVYLTLRLDHQFILRARKTGLIVGKYAMFAIAGFTILTFIYTDLTDKLIASGILVISVGMVTLCCRCLKKREYVTSFVFSTAAIVAVSCAIFTGLFPRFIVSSLDPNWSLSIYNSASNPLTLKIMTITMSIALPLVLALEGWKYHIFRQRISVAEISFELRRKLWKQLQRRITEIAGHYYDLSIILGKVKSSQTTQRTIVIQRHELKVFIQHGKRLVNRMIEMIQSLKNR